MWTSLRADRVVSEFYVGQMQVPIVLSLVDDHSQHLCHSVIYPLNAPVTVGMIGTCSKLVYTQQLIYSLWKLGAELQSVVREYGARAPPQGDVLVHQDIGCTLRGELSGSDGEHVGPTTEAIGEQQDVGVASWCDRKRPEVVNTDGDTWTFRQRHCDDGPADRHPWGFPRLALQAVAKPPPGAHIRKRSSIRNVRVVPR